MNSLSIIGRLTADPEHKTTQAGKEVTTFTVAVSRKGKDGADFFRVSAWGEMGNNCNKYLSEGKLVAVSGSVSVSAYTGHDGKPRGNLDVFAQAVEFLSPKNEGQPQETKQEPGEDYLPF